MSAFLWFVLFLSIYIAVLISFGLFFSKKQYSSSDFWLAGKNTGPLFVGFSAAASWLTAGALLAVIGFFILLGMGSVWGFVAPNILALPLIALFVKKIKQLPAVTQPELLELRYGKGLRLPVAGIITVVMILFAVSDIKGFAMVLEILYGVDPAWSALIVGLAVSVYVTLGGLSAVIATDMIQFLCLSAFILVMAGITVSGAGDVTGLSLGELAAVAPQNWWNPMSIGLPMVLIFVFAIIPGWITEQDPWQRVWAARDNRSAQRGLCLGSLLVAIVFGGCALIALALNPIYPDIAAMGFPMGMAKAEPALLTYILDAEFSNLGLALCGVALATAAMSCTDTFAASGASCVARDIYQRHLNPGATLGQMQRINRLAVLAIVVLATIGSFYIHSIIDAIHIATFIASASYFFVLMGGLFWKRGTRAGAIASLYTGFFLQTGLVIFDLARTAPMAPPFLESLHPIFMGHGVIPAMAVSGLAYLLVSLATPASEPARLDLFFPETPSDQGAAPCLPGDQDIEEAIQHFPAGKRIRLTLEQPLLIGEDWNQLHTILAQSPAWSAMAGRESLQRLEKGMAVFLTRGRNPRDLFFEAETQVENRADLIRAMVRARNEAATALAKDATTKDPARPSAVSQNPVPAT